MAYMLEKTDGNLCFSSSSGPCACDGGRDLLVLMVCFWCGPREPNTPLIREYIQIRGTSICVV